MGHCQLQFDGRIIQEIIVHDFAQLGVQLSARAAPDREHAFHAGIAQAFAQAALPDHSGGAEQDDFHPSRNAGRRQAFAGRTRIDQA